MNKGKFRTLNKPWKEILFSASGFGPNLLMVMLGAYLSNAVNPSALTSGETPPPGWEYQTISGICLILPILFSILWTIAKCFDGLIDVPFAALTDGLRTKWGNRRIPIAICFIPMVVAFAMCWYPLYNHPDLNIGEQVGNTIWLFVWALIFFSTYTLTLIAFYGSLSTVCYNERQRIRVSSYKSFFDTVSYALVYALIPVILSNAQIHIDKLAFFALPLMLTAIIPLFMIKEGERWEAKAIAQGYDVKPLATQKPVKFGESIKLTVKNKAFLKWLLVNCCSFFGLQLFLVSMNALIIGGMGLNGLQMTILNTFAFGPVPIMLYLFNRIKERKGMRFAYQVSAMTFAISIMAFFLGSNFVLGDNVLPKMIIGVFGSILGSYGIGSFFMMSYLVPTQIASVEEQLIKKNHSSMYFATQALTTSVVGAISSGLLWENIKNLWFSKAIIGIVNATDVQTASEMLGVPEATVFNLGVFLVPIITSAFCMGAFCFTFLMPKHYTPLAVYKQLNLRNTKYETIKPKFKKPIVFPFNGASITVYNALWVLSVTIFGFAWFASIMNDINTFKNKKWKKWWILLVLFLFPFGACLAYWLNKDIDQKCKELKIKTRSYNVLIIIFSTFYLNCVSLSIMQHKLNKIAKIQHEKIRKRAGDHYE